MIKKRIRCQACERTLPGSAFGKGQEQRSNGSLPRCLECGREQAKFSIRMNKSLPRFAALIEQWTPPQIQSEIEWLSLKLKFLRDERKSR
jgi:NAD-dependent SIR2 family protein deacetylase